MVAILSNQRDVILDAVRAMYTDVATNPTREFHFPTGRRACELVGYPASQLDAIPVAAVESFAGVGYPFAADVGGLGLEYPTLATMTVLEELGYYSPSLASALYDGQAILVGQTLNRAGDFLRGKYLPQLVRGEFVGSFATS